MPTKQDIENWFQEDKKRTPYEASLHFNIDVSQVWKIIEGVKDE